jgi:uncharacterized Zn finger protein (UPF0148 family)
MDAGKFLHLINESVQSRSAFFARAITEMGKRENSRWTLSALGSKSLIFEGADHDFFTADIVPKPHNRYEITNIKKVQVVESKKGGVLSQSCSDLVNALCEDDAKGADAAFSRLEALRFRSKVIPESGTVVTRDGEVRQIKVSEGLFPQDVRSAIVESFVGSVKDDVLVGDNGRVVRGFFGDGSEKFEIPIDEATRRRVVARHMKESAFEAYKSEAFQTSVRKWASLVCEEKVVDAVQDAAKFLREYQEFCLLTLDEMRNLASNALAAQGIMNPNLPNDIGLLMHRTALKVNRGDIVESWGRTAKKACDSTLLEKVKTLTESSQFEKDYATLLEYIFVEEADAKSKRGKAYLNSLKIIRSVVSKTEGNEDLVAAMDDAIGKFEGDKADDAALYEVEDLLASISSELITQIEQMSGFAAAPGAPGAEVPGAEVPGAEVPGAEAPAEFEMPPPVGGEEGGEPVVGSPGDIGEPAGMAGMAGGELDLGLDKEPEPKPETKPKKTEKKEEGEKKGEKGKEGREGKEGKKGEKDEKGEKGEKGEKREEKGEEEEKGELEPIESMGEDQLREELEGWKDNHATFIVEDGVDDCMNQLNKYVKRCGEIKAEELRKGFQAIKTLYEDVAMEAAGDPYLINPSPSAPIDPEYGYKGGKQPTKLERVKCPACKWWLGGESNVGLKESVIKKVQANESVDCPKCGTKLVTEDDDITSPEKGDYAGNVGMPHSNVGEEGKGKGKKVEEAKTSAEAQKVISAEIAKLTEKEKKKSKDERMTSDQIKAAAYGKARREGFKVGAKSEDKDITDPSKKQYAGDVKMPHANVGEGPDTPKGGVQAPGVKEMKPANISAGGITEAKCECGSGLLPTATKCPRCGKAIGGKKMAEDNDITEPTKKDYVKKVRMPHSNIGEGKCPGCPADLVIEEVDGVVAAVCSEICDVMYEATCPKCEGVCEMKEGKAYCPKCKAEVAEDQYKWGTRRRRYGYRRSAINPLEKLSAESKLDGEIDKIIDEIADDMEMTIKSEDKNVTDPTKKDYAAGTAMPHSNTGEAKGGHGTPGVGDVCKTGQVAKGTPTLAETGEAQGEKKVEPKVEDKDLTDPSKKQYNDNVKMPHDNQGEGPDKPKGGVVDPKVSEMKPAEIGGGTKTVG